MLANEQPAGPLTTTRTISKAVFGARIADANIHKRVIMVEAVGFITTFASMLISTEPSALSLGLMPTGYTTLFYNLYNMLPSMEPSCTDLLPNPKRGAYQTTYLRRREDKRLRKSNSLHFRSAT